jgi:hypothetical protein
MRGPFKGHKILRVVGRDLHVLKRWLTGPNASDPARLLANAFPPGERILAGRYAFQRSRENMGDLAFMHLAREDRGKLLREQEIHALESRKADESTKIRSAVAKTAAIVSAWAAHHKLVLKHGESAGYASGFIQQFACRKDEPNLDDLCVWARDWAQVNYCAAGNSRAMPDRGILNALEDSVRKSAGDEVKLLCGHRDVEREIENRAKESAIEATRSWFHSSHIDPNYASREYLEEECRAGTLDPHALDEGIFSASTKTTANREVHRGSGACVC